MSVVETKIIDGMGKSKDKNALVLMISDHLDWVYEAEHLLFLQEKINAYIAFLESKQYKETYPGGEFDFYVIEIHFKYDISESCLKFLDKIANMVEPLKIRIKVEISA